MISVLSLRQVARSRNGVDYGTGPVLLYEVEGLPHDKRISIRNARAAAQPPVWQIGAHVKGRETRWAGTFESPEDALAHLQDELNSADEDAGGDQ